MIDLVPILFAVIGALFAVLCGVLGFVAQRVFARLDDLGQGLGLVSQQVARLGAYLD